MKNHRGAAKRELPEAGTASSWAARCPELSINPPERNKSVINWDEVRRA
jgi:hypothetical protein